MSAIAKPKNHTVSSEQSEQKVIITDIRMSFISMVVFMVKWSIAAIPALFILFLLGNLSMLLLAKVFSNGSIQMLF
ncbi:MAG: hypothetical protein HQM07_07525 [Zetaproteobacteria bacterium]|nr:hypothetical protein [Zetaproteobacteria bacterium]